MIRRSSGRYRNPLGRSAVDSRVMIVHPSQFQPVGLFGSVGRWENPEVLVVRGCDTSYGAGRGRRAFVRASGF